MMQDAVQLNKYPLWAASIAGSLLLQLFLVHLLWQVCTAYDHRPQPVMRAININPAPINHPAPTTEVADATPDLPPVQKAVEAEPVKPQPEAVIPEPELPETKPVMPEKIAEKPLIPEPELPAIKPEMPPEPVKAVPVKPAPDFLEPEVFKPPVIKKAKARPEKKIKPDQPPLKKPVKALERTHEKSQTPSEVLTPATIPVTRPATAISENASTARPQTNAKAETGKPAAAIPALPAKDFSPYLQKIYRIIEKNKRYPAEAKQRGLNGKVLVSFSINADGRVSNASAQNTVAPELQQAALKLLAGQRFPQPPAEWNTQSRINMTINYSIR